MSRRALPLVATLLTLLLACVLASSSPFDLLDGVHKPGIRTVVTQAGLNRLLNVALHLLRNKFETVRLSKVEGEKHVAFPVGTINYELSDITIHNWDIGFTSFIALGPGIILLELHDLEAHINMNYHWRQHNLPHLYGKGQVAVAAQRGTIKLQIDITAVNNRPHINCYAASIEFKNYDIKVHSTFSWLYSIITHLFHNKVNRGINEALSQRAADILNHNANVALQSIPEDVIFKMGKFDMAADLLLTDDPVITPDYVVVNDLAHFDTVDLQKCPLYANDLPTKVNDDSLQLIIDQSVANCALWVLQRENALTARITEAQFPSIIPMRLNTTSWQNWVPQLPQQFGLDKAMTLDAQVVAPPSVQVSEKDSLYFTAQLLIGFNVVQDDGTQARALDFDLALVGSAKLSVSGDDDHTILVPEVSFLKSVTTLKESYIGDVDTVKVTRLLDYLVPSSKAIINKKVADGFQVPHVKGIHLQNPKLTFNDGFVAVTTDFYYMPEALLNQIKGALAALV